MLKFMVINICALALNALTLAVTIHLQNVEKLDIARITCIEHPPTIVHPRTRVLRGVCLDTNQSVKFIRYDDK